MNHKKVHLHHCRSTKSAREVQSRLDRLSATDVYTQPSHREGFCNSLLEAGAMALPSITYDICGCNDSVDNETGILVPPYDAEALYTAMTQLLCAPARRQQLGQAARKRMEERFDRRYVWQELRRFYRKAYIES